jgi:hypothetical protein
MKWYKHSLVLVLSLLLFSCNNDTDPQSFGDWIIPADQVFDGGPGKDGIPSVDNPEFSLVSEIGYLDDDDLVIGVKVGDDIRAYPHPILDWHEIVNDEPGGKALAITYCPLTGTGIAWDRVINGQTTTFGVSGLLYNTNLIPYDRNTDSNWSQMLLQSVNGEKSGKQIETYPLLETTWATWKKLFPNSLVMNTNTGFSRDYNQYPYGDYRTNDNFIIFPISTTDDRLPRKDRGLGIIINDQAKFYPLNAFDNEQGCRLIQDQFAGKELALVGSIADNYIMTFERILEDGTLLEFELLENTNGEIFIDQEGNQWNIFGEAISGPREGEQLKIPTSYIGYWFAWGTFYPGLDLYE